MNRIDSKEKGLKVIVGGSKRSGRKASDETPEGRKARAVGALSEIFKEAESAICRPSNIKDAHMALRAVAALCTNGPDEDDDRMLEIVAFPDMGALLRVISRSLEPQP